jgi:hypothetical protein
MKPGHYSKKDHTHKPLKGKGSYIHKGEPWWIDWYESEEEAEEEIKRIRERHKKRKD